MKELTATLGVNWKYEIGLDWYTALTDVLGSDYIKNLNTFIEQIYLSGREIYPIKPRLFESFKQCSLLDTKIVIIDNNPVKDLRSSGIGRGIIESPTLGGNRPLELRQFVNCIYETVYGNQYSPDNFDNSLYDYCDEGMLFLNASMCIERDKDYSIVWKHFIRNVIQELNKRKEKVVYLFLTGDNLDLKQYIDESKNKIIVNPFSTLMSYSTVFTQIDEYINDNYSLNHGIVW